MVDEEMTRSGHLFGSVHCVCFSALTLFTGWQEGRPAHINNLWHLFPNILIRNKWRKNTEGENQLIDDHWGWLLLSWQVKKFAEPERNKYEYKGSLLFDSMV